MGTKGNSVIAELQDLVNRIDNDCAKGFTETPTQTAPCCIGICCKPCCEVPCVTPPGAVPEPKIPQAVTILSMQHRDDPFAAQLTPEEREFSRYDNFYNNYNIDWRAHEHESEPASCPPNKRMGVTVDGKSACCDHNLGQDKSTAPLAPQRPKSCPMKLVPPPSCNPGLPWVAEVQLCRPKTKDDTC